MSRGRFFKKPQLGFERLLRYLHNIFEALQNAFKKKKKKKKRKSNMIPLFRRKFLREFWGKPYGQIPAQSLLQ